MNRIQEFMLNWVESIWQMLVDSAFLLLIGLTLAGLLSIILNSDRIKKYISGNKKSNVFKAALIGVPLPLCSCSVLPVAKQLRESGVSKGGTVSFLISTPESGIDSIMLTYTLMDPLMTVARPITAFITAAAAGLIETNFEDDEQEAPINLVADNCSDSCCPDNSDELKLSEVNFSTKIWNGIKYGFTSLLDDLAIYLLIGYVLAGLVSVVLGNNLLTLSDTFTNGWGSYLGAIVIGVPLYICATSSTPLAAALLAGGFSPGAVLVFMMVGPATNIASLVVLGRILKGWSTVRYVAAIIIISILCGITIDFIYDYFNIESIYRQENEHDHSSLLSIFSAAILSFLILYYSLKTLFGKFNK